MIPPRGTGHLRVWAGLALVLAFVGLVHGCPPPNSHFVFPDGFLRNDTTSNLSRRWTAIKPGDGDGEKFNNDGTNHFGKQWRDGLVTICFDPTVPDDEVAMFRDGVRRGMALWYIYGLSSSSFRIDDDPKICQSQGVTGPKADWLWVTKATGPTMWASYGNLNTGSEFHAHPDSAFTSREGVPDPTVEKARTYAHELGHVFGLLHEQQNPNAWTRPRGGLALADMFKFDCTNLYDYDLCLSNVKQQFNNDAAKVQRYMSDMCKSSVAVALHPCWDGKSSNEGGFYLSAHQWLPQAGSPQWVQASKQVDLNSVMLYNSYGGTKTKDVAVYLLNDPNNGETVLKADDGYSFHPPSALDIEGAVMMSPNGRDSTSAPPYYTPASQFHATWESQDNPFDDCHASSVTRRGTALNKRYEQLKRRGAEARVAMRRRLAAGSYI